MSKRAKCSGCLCDLLTSEKDRCSGCDSALDDAAELTAARDVVKAARDVLTDWDSLPVTVQPANAMRRLRQATDNYDRVTGAGKDGGK